MSASLVGSEMCIRDRLETPHPTQRAKLCSRYSVIWSERAHKPVEVFTVCLLYTSDAADDM
eukprot:12660507-Alexandrium_andersonii.AAC.1